MTRPEPTTRPARRSTRSHSVLTARTADKHQLYEDAVQNPDAELDFMTRVFRQRHGRVPIHIREDFCGTAFIASTWVARSASNYAVGVDLDRPTLLEHSKRHTAKLTDDQRARLTLVHANVCSPALPKRPKVDAILALNFSYWILHARADLLGYFKLARAALKPGGLFILDHFSGSDVHREITDRRRCTGFTYLWDQAHYDPFTARYTCKIHFEFRDGTALRNAFVYQWRLWSIAELRDILTEAGFTKIDLYGEGTTKAGDGNGVYTKREHHPADRALLAYIVAER